MRRNIETIIKATKCNEEQAQAIETYINQNAIGFYWDSASLFEMFKEAKLAASELYPSLKY